MLKINILWLDATNICDIPNQVVKEINRQKQHTAIFIQGYKGINPFGLTHGKYVSEMRQQEFIKNIEWADIIHCSDTIPNNTVSTKLWMPEWKCSDGRKINVIEYFKSHQKVFIHHNGSICRAENEQFNSICTKHNISQTVSTPDLLYYAENSVLIPQILDVDNVCPFNPPILTDVIKISHSPTSWDIKSTGLFLKNVRNISKTEKIELVLITNKTLKECLDIRKNCHIHYDQILLGTYGISAAEALALGQLCLVNVRITSQFYKRLPFININMNTFQVDVQKSINILHDEKQRTKYLKRGRKWVEEHHSPKKIYQQLIELYEKSPFFR